MSTYYSILLNSCFRQFNLVAPQTSVFSIEFLASSGCHKVAQALMSWFALGAHWSWSCSFSRLLLLMMMLFGFEWAHNNNQ